VKPEVSALMDGALDESATESMLNAFRSQPELRGVWDAYHLIGDSLRRSPAVSPAFTGRILERLEAEPTVLAPKSRRRSPAKRFLVPIAASLMGVGVVAWVAQSLNVPAPTTHMAAARNVNPPASSNVAAAPVQVPQQANLEVGSLAYEAPWSREYLFVHQSYSPRTDIQGVAHYLRSVYPEQSVAK